MKKFTLIVLSVILAAAMLASCTQYRVIWIPGMDDQNTPSTSQSAKDTFSLIDALDAQLPKDIEEVMAAPDAVQGLTRTDSAGTISMASRSWEATYSATFSFNEYPVAGYGTIKTGTLTIKFQGTESTEASETTFSATTSKMDFNNLSVLKTNETIATPVEIKNLEGASKAVIKTDSSRKVISASGISNSMSIKQSISSSTTITVDNVNVPAKDVADSNTSGDFASGLGTKDFPYVIRSEEQFANISKYSEKMKNGAYYYFSIESDLDYSTGNIYPYIENFRGELDFNNHKLEGLSFTRMTELNNGTQITTLIYYWYGGVIRNLDFRPTGQLNLVMLAEPYPQSQTTTTFLMENISAGDKNNPITYKVGNNASPFISQIFGPNSELTMRNCVNYDNMVQLSGDHHMGIFLSGYGAYAPVDITFDNCDNWGTISGYDIGYLIGNDTKGIDTDGYRSIYAKDCDNHGALYASNACGFIGLNDSKYELVFKGENNNQGIIKKLKPVSATATLKDNDTIVISDIDTSEYSTFEVSATGYASLKGADGSNGGTLMVGVYSGILNVSDIESLAFRKLVFIDKEYVSETVTDVYNNEIATVNGTDYYAIDLSTKGSGPFDMVFDDASHTLTDITYTLTCYDSAGNLAGSLDLNI